MRAPLGRATPAVDAVEAVASPLPSAAAAAAASSGGERGRQPDSMCASSSDREHGASQMGQQTTDGPAEAAVATLLSPASAARHSPPSRCAKTSAFFSRHPQTGHGTRSSASSSCETASGGEGGSDGEDKG